MPLSPEETAFAKMDPSAAAIGMFHKIISHHIHLDKAEVESIRRLYDKMMTHTDTTSPGQELHLAGMNQIKALLAFYDAVAEFNRLYDATDENGDLPKSTEPTTNA